MLGLEFAQRRETGRHVEEVALGKGWGPEPGKKSAWAPPPPLLQFMSGVLMSKDGE